LRAIRGRALEGDDDDCFGRGGEALRQRGGDCLAVEQLVRGVRFERNVQRERLALVKLGPSADGEGGGGGEAR